MITSSIKRLFICAVLLCLLLVTQTIWASSIQMGFDSGEIDESIWTVEVVGEHSEYKFVDGFFGGKALYLKGESGIKGDEGFVRMTTVEEFSPAENYEFSFDFTQPLDGQGGYSTIIRHVHAGGTGHWWIEGMLTWMNGGFILYTQSDALEQAWGSRWEPMNLLPDMPYRFTVQVKDGKLSVTIYDLLLEELVAESPVLAMDSNKTPGVIQIIVTDGGQGTVRDVIIENVVYRKL